MVRLHRDAVKRTGQGVSANSGSSSVTAGASRPTQLSLPATELRAGQIRGAEDTGCPQL